MRKTILLFTLSLLTVVVWGQAYSYRYWTDNDVAAAKTGSASGETLFTVDVASLSNGLHALHVQAKNASGVWSSTRTRHFLIDRSEMQAAATARYWIDNDMTTVHNGVATSGTIDVELPTLASGLHAIHYQTFAADGTPSSARTRYFLVDKSQMQKAITARYWIDNDMTTVHNGVATSGTIDIDVSKLTVGLHAIHYQTFAADGTPSSARTRYILVDKVHQGILKATVSIDGGTATTHALAEGDVVIDIGELAAGEHTVSVTLIDIEGNDYGTETSTFMVYDGNEPIEFADNLTKTICLYYWDTNGDGELSRNEAAAVERIGTVFQGYDITSFDELQYFTGLTELCDMEFAECKKLTSVVIPPTVETVAGGIFYFCDALTSVRVANGNVWLDSRNDCNAIIETSTGRLLVGCKTTIIPNDVTAIGELAFYHCHGLEHLTIPQSVTAIEFGGLFGCMDLKELVIPRSVTFVGEEAIGNCNVLEKLTVEQGNPVYDSRNNCNGIIETVTNTLVAGCITTAIPTTVTAIASFAFDSFPLTALHIPAGVTSIATEAVRLCHNLKDITVDEANTVFDSRGGCNAVMHTATNTLVIGGNKTVIPAETKSIGDYAFYGLNYLNEINIPRGVTTIGDGAFYGCDSLWVVTVGMPTPPAITENTFTNRFYATLYVPAGKRPLYEAAPYWQDFYEIIETDPTNVIAPADVTTRSGEQVVMPINITNDADLTVVGVSFTLALPTGVTLALDDDGEPMYDLVSARLNPKRFSVYTNQNADGSWGFRISTNTQTAKLSGTEGAALTLTLNVADNLAPGNYTVTLKENTLSVRESDNSVNTLVLNNSKGTLTVSNVTMGDVNDDGNVDLSDAIMVIYHSLGVTSPNFIEDAADMNGDGDIDLSDAIIIIYISLGVDVGTAYSRGAMAVAESADQLSLTSDGTACSLALDNSMEYVGFQFDVRLSDNLSIDELLLNESRCGGHTLMYNQLSDGRYRVMVFSPTGSTLFGSMGQLMTFQTNSSAKGGTLTIENIFFVDTQLQKCRFANLSWSVTTGIDAVAGAGREDKTYDLQGRHIDVSTLKKGVYVTDGKKFVR